MSLGEEPIIVELTSFGTKLTVVRQDGFFQCRIGKRHASEKLERLRKVDFRYFTTIERSTTNRFQRLRQCNFAFQSAALIKSLFTYNFQIPGESELLRG